MLPYEDCKVVGPHIKDDDYQRMIIYWPSGNKTNVNYHKYLMEVHIGRYLDEDEVVHHIDENPANNNIDNLQIMKRRDHIGMHHKKEAMWFNCPWCGLHFKVEGARLVNYKRNIKNKKTKDYQGPFCTVSHASKYTNTRRWLSAEALLNYKSNGIPEKS